jgi:superfamily II DNA or RNA helicase
MYNLRPYQEKAVSDLIAGIKGGCKKIILQAPTGSGKTIIGSRIIHGASRKSKKVLFLAHRSELISQCSEKLSAMDVFHGIIQGSRPPQASASVWVASVQTLVNRTIPAPDIIIIDEAHHARAGSYEKIIARYPDALLLGLTATPGRIDGKGLGTLFEKIIPVISYQDLIAQGFLVPFHIWEPTTIDFTGVKVTGGDFNQKEKQARL